MNVWIKFSIIGVTSICETYVIKYEIFLSLVRKTVLSHFIKKIIIKKKKKNFLIT